MKTGLSLGVARESRVSAPKSLNVATGLYLPSQTASADEVMSRSPHVNRGGAIAGFETVVFPNFFATATIAGEAGPGAATSIAASIEYPVGVFTQILFGGAAIGSMPDNGVLASDPVTVAIPDGALFFVRAWRRNTTFTLAVNSGGNPTLGSAYRASTTVTDQTMSGTITGNANGFTYTPVAIVAKTMRPSLVAIGDSRTFGTNATASLDGLTTPDSGNICPRFGAAVPAANFGRMSDQAQFFAASAANRLALMAYYDRVAIALGVNDIRTSSRSLAQVQADLATIFANPAFAGKRLYLATIEGYYASSDAWATIGGQSAPASEASRTGFNSWARGMPGTLQRLAGVMDVSAALSAAAGVEGHWPANGSPNYATPDGIHSTFAAYDLVRTSGAFGPSLLI